MDHVNLTLAKCNPNANPTKTPTVHSGRPGFELAIGAGGTSARGPHQLATCSPSSGRNDSAVSLAKLQLQQSQMLRLNPLPWAEGKRRRLL
eukprot:1329075-Amorphochlora_amoeboformis.AAC.1